MKHAVTIRPTADARQAIRSLWEALERDGIPLGFDPSLFEPHITLAVVEADEAHADGAIAALEAWCRRFAARLTHIPIHLPFLGLFPPFEEQGGVLFVGAAAHGPLGDAFHAFQAGLPAVGRVTSPLYAPARWSPHITLALNLDAPALDRALGRALRAFQPLVTEAADLELYELMPVERVLRIALGPCACPSARVRDKRLCNHCEQIRYQAPD